MAEPSRTLALDTARMISTELARQEEALIKTMLCVWDPAWGDPQVVQRNPSEGDLRVLQQGGPNRRLHIQCRVLGLAVLCGPAEVLDVRVYATDHIDELGHVKAPTTDRGMLAICEARVAAAQQSKGPTS